MDNRRSLLGDDDNDTTREMRNVFDDEFEIDDFDVVADGFRPGQSHDREGGPSAERSGSGSAQYTTGSIVGAGAERSSTRKSQARENPFASPEDREQEQGEEEQVPLRRTPSGNFTSEPEVNRSVSSASSANFADSSSSPAGVEGPSHPYGMYPQGTVARSPSAATSSTARPTRQSSGRYAPGPQHPYSLYPQGVSDDLDGDDDEEPTTQNPVPLGFLGVGQQQQFRRQRGPDGEEQYIIGEYGHTEQLPPYSRYPEDALEKAPLLDVPAPPPSLHSRAPVLGTDPGMSLMHTQILPPSQRPQSMMDDSDLQRQNSRLSRQSLIPDSADDEETSAETSLLSKRTWHEKSWSERRKTKFCGIPFWLVVVLTLSVIFAGGILGGALGGFAAGQISGHQAAAAAAASSTLYDASLITTATAAPPPTGTFPLSLGFPQETEAACLTVPADRQAWSCDLAGSDQIWISIQENTDGNATGASLFTKAGDMPSNQLSYGTQVADMFTAFSPFLYVHDNDDPNAGPAFYFQQTYTKVVVTPAEMIDQSSRKLKRSAYDSWPDFLVQKQYATPGDKPWFCYWNGTLMEGFIYKNQPAATLPSLSSSSPSSTTSSSSTSTITTPPNNPNNPYGAATSQTAAWTIPGVAPSDTVTTTVQMSTTSCIYSGVASAFPAWMQSNYPNFENLVLPSGTPSDPKDKRERGAAENNNNNNNNTDGNDGVTPFPFLVKIEERRLTHSPAPMCVQYQVLNDYNWGVITDPSGAQVTITLAETDPPYAAYQQAGEAGTKRDLELRFEAIRKRTVPGGCHCQWMSGE